MRIIYSVYRRCMLTITIALNVEGALN